MQLNIAFNEDVLSVEVDPASSVATLKAILEAETGVPTAGILLKHNGVRLPDSEALSARGVHTGDLIMMERAAPAPPRPAAAAAAPAPAPAPAAAAPPDAGAMHPDGSAVHPELVMAQLRGGGQLASLPESLRGAILAGDVAAFQSSLRAMAAARRGIEAEEQRLMRAAEEDPFNPEVQRQLEEAIQKKNVDESYKHTMEEHPEFFGDVFMLYVPMEVNGVPLKAFVDSGAQMTIMGRSCAERCGLLRLMDTHFSGVAKGVGSSKILGRIHMAPLKAGNQFFPSSITVLEQDGMEFLFGLDNLKRHQCCIDLAANALRFGSTAISLPFLPEHEIPKRLLTDEFETLPPGAEAQPPAPAGEAPPPAALQQQQQQQQQPGAAGQAAALPAGWEDKVARLQALGFSRGQCDAALRSTGGDEELAGSMLFSME